MIEWADQAGAMWQYIVLFLLAFAPFLDVSIIVPLGVLWGLSPLGVGIISFLGNFLLLVLLGIFFRQYAKWRTQWRLKQGITQPSKTETKSRKICDKYGIPGLALVAPVFVGTDIAAVLALTFGSSRAKVMSWMTLSLVLWTIIFMMGSKYGFSFLNWI
jgi:uncharacterized membrane protein